MELLRNCILCLLAVSLSSSCATSSAMETFPQRKIERTPQNTAGVSSWGTLVAGRKTQSHYGQRNEVAPVVLPIFYSFHALDNVLVDAAVIPNKMAIQIAAEETSDSTVNLGFQFSSEDYIGDVVDGSLGFSRRSYLSHEIVVDTSVELGRLFYFNSGPQNLHFEVTLRPEIQVGDIFWIRPGVGFRTEYQEYFSGNTGNVSYFTKERMDFLFPITLEASLSIVKNFEVIGKYSLDYLGEKDGAFDQRYQVGFMLYF